MVKFEGYKLVMNLEAQMPMIHFQSMQCGATLRASEMKPKFDAYLLNKLCKEGCVTLKELKKGEDRDIFMDASSDNNDALDYKVQITVSEPVIEVDLNDKTENYSIFYANMGRKDDKIYGVFSKPTVTIVCFKEKLRNLIESSIENFFLTTNFGTMQNKGFGSFAPKEWLKKAEQNGVNKEWIKEVSKAYKELIPNGKCYTMVFKKPYTNIVTKRNADCVEMSEAIKRFYSIMKSGENRGKDYKRSYIYQYGHNELELGNEKAWMKKMDIAPIVCKKGNEKYSMQGQQEYRFLRAFLGIGETIEYGTGYRTNDKGKEVLDKTTVKQINIKSKEFERVSSPIYFKVIQNVVFIVAFDVPEEIYGAKFEFSSKLINKREKKNIVGAQGTICVPNKQDGKETFNIHKFLASYVKYYNGLQIFPLVKEVD